jgi:hypothetical protein
MSRHTAVFGNFPRFLRLLPRPARALAAGILLAAGLSLAACFERPQSLADYIAAICSTRFRSSSPEEAPFLAENVSAMTKMMIEMGIRPSGDVDTDFAAIMTPHHQGAIEMAESELRHGHNEQLRRLAQEIIVTQRQEIVAMRLALGQPLNPVSSPPDLAASVEQANSKPGPQPSLHPQEQ